uniref:Uncharacterized protein n=1 Tax=Chromera velia CCMP2878 TaxID=1169474 RepID=A0A0G4HZH7_9ALVE|mmetsp:Transcript_11124/g.21484  ORF Transcript_11124/g.21484 Transcript_11124/m.21484 type:complete len:168 (+) Transcript_11124:141-644(+)|eukprot:Cvel_9739.t1-p1 / transcript=Cvel_9739.t1 / gene=Cvel_9739 / organism=Chromera_velia_CCMP2878 / gene_product=hypothetical protein / transcript_product=hypothetical protein / location=Cvel_scaffold569:43501-44756(-) / protein_length=167 / sequence_SO=supercontig / SO=protein_coding / is_pseudo=false
MAHQYAPVGAAPAPLKVVHNTPFNLSHQTTNESVSSSHVPLEHPEAFGDNPWFMECTLIDNGRTFEDSRVKLTAKPGEGVFVQVQKYNGKASFSSWSTDGGWFGKNDFAIRGVEVIDHEVVLRMPDREQGTEVRVVADSVKAQIFLTKYKQLADFVNASPKKKSALC